MGRKPCCSKEGVKKGAWTASEDEILTDYIAAHGEGKWRHIPKLSGLKRCGKSCRLRWLNYLRPDIKRGNISADEQDLIIRLHKLLGNRWSLIAGRLPGRTDNEIKNYWNTHLAKKPQSSQDNQFPPNMSDPSLPLRKSDDTKLLSSSPIVPSIIHGNTATNTAKSNHSNSSSLPIPCTNEENHSQTFSDFGLEFEMGDISITEEDIDNFFSEFSEVQDITRTANFEWSLHDLTDSLENWGGRCNGKSTGSIRLWAPPATSDDGDWLGDILY